MTNDTFWKRYLFRVHQVEKEEDKRKALLQGKPASNEYSLNLLLNLGSVENDEEFSWEDDEEDVTASTGSLSKKDQAMNNSTSSENTLGIAKSGRPANNASTPSSQFDGSATTSPRLSSEDSYDLVSSGNVSTAGETTVRTKKGDDDEPDSDWE